MRDRKTYQAAYYQRNKAALNAREAVARRKSWAANGGPKLNAPKLHGGKAAKAISDWSARNLVVPQPLLAKANFWAWRAGKRIGFKTPLLRASRRPRCR